MKNRQNRGFGAAVRVTNQQAKPEKEITEDVAIERLSKESLEALRAGRTTNQVPQQPQSVKVLNDNAPADDPEPVPAIPATLSITREELTAIAQLAAEAATKQANDRINEMQAKLDEAEKQSADKLAAVELEKQSAADKLAVFTNLFALNGNPNPVTPAEVPAMPAFNKTVGSKSDRPEGALAEFMSIQGPRKNSNGVNFISTATPAHSAFIRENMNALMRDLESYGKQNGLFRGNSNSEMGSLADTNAITSGSNIPGGFLETLSPIMRETHRPTRIFWQFPNTRLDFRANNGTTIDIPRAAIGAEITDPDDRKLSGSGVYADIQSDSDEIQTGIVKATVEEWGRGKAGTTAKPLGISRFVQAFSMIELIQIINNVLMIDYERWEDLVIKRLWSPTSRVVYANNSSVVETPGAVASQAAGRLTWEYLTELFSYKRQLQIPTYADGCYGLALTTQAMTQLKRSLGSNFSFETVVDTLALSNLLNLAAPGEVGKVTGYQGKIGNFHVFESNSFSRGAAGTEGVRSEAITGGNTVTRTNFSFGADTIGRGIAEPFQLVDDEVTNFGRRQRVTWLSWEGFCQLDVDPGASADLVPQQLRVLDVRFTD